MKCPDCAKKNRTSVMQVHTVKKDGPNHGREFYSCPTEGCKGFKWRTKSAAVSDDEEADEQPTFTQRKRSYNDGISDAELLQAPLPTPSKAPRREQLDMAYFLAQQQMMNTKIDQLLMMLMQATSKSDPSTGFLPRQQQQNENGVNVRASGSRLSRRGDGEDFGGDQ